VWIVEVIPPDAEGAGGLLYQVEILVELDIRPLNFDIESVAESVGSVDFYTLSVVLLGLLVIPSGANVGVERAFSDRVIFGFDAKAVFADFLDLEWGAVGCGVSRMNES
jgi:hypothetical protein